MELNGKDRVVVKRHWVSRLLSRAHAVHGNSEMQLNRPSACPRCSLKNIL